MRRRLFTLLSALSLLLCVATVLWVRKSNGNVPPKVRRDCVVVLRPPTTRLRERTLPPGAAARIVRILQAPPVRVGPSKGKPISQFKIDGRAYEWHAGFLVFQAERGERWAWEDPALEKMADVLWKGYPDVSEETIDAVLHELEISAVGAEHREGGPTTAGSQR
jgi:hypothetical protein